MLVGVLTLLILAVTCTNLVGLQLVRGVAREREIGIRLGLRASASRIFRQLLTESVALALMATLLFGFGRLFGPEPGGRLRDFSRLANI